MATRNQPKQPQRQKPPRHLREPGEYPYPIQRAGDFAMTVYDRLQGDLIDDGFSQEDADMLLDINMDQVLAQADREWQEHQAIGSATDSKTSAESTPGESSEPSPSS